MHHHVQYLFLATSATESAHFELNQQVLNHLEGYAYPMKYPEHALDETLASNITLTLEALNDAKCVVAIFYGADVDAETLLYCGYAQHRGVSLIRLLASEAAGKEGDKWECLFKKTILLHQDEMEWTHPVLSTINMYF
jgi:hypothetical protein